MLTKHHAEVLDARRISPATRKAIERCLSGESLRDAALVAGVHFTTVHEAMQRAGLTADWKKARAARLRQANAGRMPAVYARHFGEDVETGEKQAS